MAVCQDGEALAFKLSGEEREFALELTSAALWDPFSKRPMKNWVVVPQAHQGDWLRLAHQAVLNVQTAIL